MRSTYLREAHKQARSAKNKPLRTVRRRRYTEPMPARKPQGFRLQTTRFLQAARWSFARLGILGILGILGLGLCWSANTLRRLQTAPPQFCQTSQTSPTSPTAAHPIIRKPQTVYRPHACPQAARVYFFALRACLCASRR